MVLSNPETTVSEDAKSLSIVIIILVVFYTQLYASDSSASDISAISDKSIFNIEYLTPTEDDRNIDTLNIDINMLLTRFKMIDLSFYYGITATYVTGSITQLEGNINQGTLREASFDNSAYGIGPGLSTSLRLFDSNKIALLINLSGNLIVYNERFPAGGEYYNLMWRGGAVIEYKLDPTKSIGLSHQWTHVSNGQGATSENPSYEASGFGLRFMGIF